ncbi:MAG: hypothetical protein ND866_16180 [Pyrinomonadaceae bacterium]|nr:hypothetical protein [Pyrinomonadaceae bacterium]
MTKCAVLFATMTLVFVGTGFGQKPATMTVKVYFHNEKPQTGQLGPVKAGLDFLITDNSVGPVRLGTTVAQARRALRGFTLSRTSDGEGIALIAVKRGKQTVMTLYAGEQDPRSRINERARIEFIEVWDPRYYTSAGVHPKMPLREVEQKYGQLKEIRLSEIEAREFATFSTHPSGIQLRVGDDSGMAGIYNEGKNTTARYSHSAYLMSISITGRGNATAQFSSRYTDLKKQCKNPAPARVEGHHTSLFCQGCGGFQFHNFDAATMAQINLQTLDRKISHPLTNQSLTYDQQVSEIEWRLADGNGYSQQTGQLSRNEWETLEDFARRIIPQGMQLAHSPLEDNFGPSRKSMVILFEADKAAAKSYEGWVLVPGLTGYVKYDLPKPEVTWSIEEPKAVLFANADKDPAQELFIIAECYTGIGPTGAQPFNRTRVYDWNGSGFTHLETVSTTIGTAATARAVQKKLKRRP